MTNNTEIRQSVENHFGSLANFAETLIGAGIATEYQRLRDQGLSIADASKAIKDSPLLQQAGKIFGPIGLTASALSSVTDAVIEGGAPSDYVSAAVSAIGGVLGAGCQSQSKTGPDRGLKRVH